MTTPANKIQNINTFFELYAAAMEKNDTKAMAYMYSVPCTMLSDEATTIFSDFSKLEGLFNQALSFYRQFGIAHMQASLWTYQNLSKRIVKARVNWRYLAVTGELIYNCDYEYILKLDRYNQWKIILSVSVNEKERMEAYQNKSMVAQ